MRQGTRGRVKTLQQEKVGMWCFDPSGDLSGYSFKTYGDSVLKTTFVVWRPSEESSVVCAVTSLALLWPRCITSCVSILSTIHSFSS